MQEMETQLLALLAQRGSLGNGRARQLLGWDEATYHRVKQALVAKGQVAIGLGLLGAWAMGLLAYRLQASGYQPPRPPPKPARPRTPAGSRPGP